jgi:hypothetical protein
VKSAAAVMSSLPMGLVIGAALPSAPAETAESRAIPRIGVAVLANSSLEQGLRIGLRELGYIEWILRSGS